MITSTNKIFTALCVNSDKSKEIWNYCISVSVA